MSPIRDTRRILKVCRSCKALMFCVAEHCPVCDSALERTREDFGDLDFPTLDSMASRVLKLSDRGLREELEQTPERRLPDLQYANIGFEQFLPHFLERRRRMGVCDYCRVITVAKGHCHLCQRQKRFNLRSEDLLLPHDRCLEDASSELKEKLNALGLDHTQVVTLLRIHTLGNPLKKRPDGLAFNDLVIKHALGDLLLDEFLSDAVGMLDNCSDEEFGNLLLDVELRKARLSLGQLEQAWAESMTVKTLWGAMSSERWISDLKSIYRANYNLFQEGIAAINDYHQEEARRRKLERAEAEAAARALVYEAEREQATRAKIVSDWWLERADDPPRVTKYTGFAQRSWKHRWRKPW